jgi:peptidoglycan hydrolase-like protein with peptidoglycan-binding domain
MSATVKKLASRLALTGVVLAATLLGPGVAQAAPSPDSSNATVDAATRSDNRFAPNATAAYPYCTAYNNVPLKANGNEFGQIPVSSAGYNCILEKGNSSSAVSRLQNHLNSCYGKGLAVDGVFGNGTYTALIQVQRAIGATADGVYGPGTRSKMAFFASNLGCYGITAYSGF